MSRAVNYGAISVLFGVFGTDQVINPIVWKMPRSIAAIMWTWEFKSGLGLVAILAALMAAGQYSDGLVRRKEQAPI
jgi:hypothetical protein